MSNQLLRHKKFLLVLIILAIVIVVIIVKLDKDHNKKVVTTKIQQATAATVTIPPSGMSYPTGWQQLSRITTADQQAGVVSVALRSTPSAEAIVRVSNGALPASFNINTVPAETVSKLKSSLTGFSLVGDGVTTVGKNQAVSITYTTASSGQAAYEYTELIVPTTNKSFYLTISAKKTDFTKITSDVSTITNNFGSYISSNQ